METGKEFELGNGKVRFIPLGMFQEREKNFKKKSFDEQVRRSLPYVGAAVIGEAADMWGQLSRWVWCWEGEAFLSEPVCSEKYKGRSSTKNRREEVTDLR